MYSNTIYILNNTIIECFDIAFNERTKKKEKRNPSFPLTSFYKSWTNSHLSKTGQWRGNYLMNYKRAIPLFRFDSRIIASRGRKPKQKKGDNIVISQSLPEHRWRAWSWKLECDNDHKLIHTHTHLVSAQFTTNSATVSEQKWERSDQTLCKWSEVHWGPKWI